jgi:hypothetical protein
MSGTGNGGASAAGHHGSAKPRFVGRARPEHMVAAPPPPGQAPIVAAGLAIGILLLAIQLWLLTVALDLYLAGHGDQVWSLAAVSGLILRRRPRAARPWATAKAPGRASSGEMSR